MKFRLPHNTAWQQALCVSVSPRTRLATRAPASVTGAQRCASTPRTAAPPMVSARSPASWYAPCAVPAGSARYAHRPTSPQRRTGNTAPAAPVKCT